MTEGQIRKTSTYEIVSWFFPAHLPESTRRIETIIADEQIHRFWSKIFNMGNQNCPCEWEPKDGVIKASFCCPFIAAIQW